MVINAIKTSAPPTAPPMIAPRVLGEEEVVERPVSFVRRLETVDVILTDKGGRVLIEVTVWTVTSPLGSVINTCDVIVEGGGVVTVGIKTVEVRVDVGVDVVGSLIVVHDDP